MSVGEEDYGNLSRPKRRRRVRLTLVILVVLLVAFHRPLLLGLGYRIALHYAAREHLKLAFRVEGSVFTNLTIRNLHATPTGPTDIESIDADFVHVDYGLLTLFRHGLSDAARYAE